MDWPMASARKSPSSQAKSTKATGGRASAMATAPSSAMARSARECGTWARGPDNFNALILRSLDKSRPRFRTRREMMNYSVKTSIFCLHPDANTSAFRVDIEPDETIYGLKVAIKRELPHTLAHLDVDQLDLFLARRGDAWLVDDANCNEVDDLLMQPLRDTAPIGRVFQDLTVGTIHVLVRKRLTGRLLGVPVKRLERWDALNRGLRCVNSDDKTPYASLTWDDVRGVYNPLLDKEYRLPVTPVPDATLDFLERVFTMKQASYCSMSRFAAPPALLFVESILLAVASLLQPVGHIKLDKSLDGGYLNVDGTIDMMLTQAMDQDIHKRVCVVEVKGWDDVLTDMARALVAMEVVSQRDCVETTYAIVTDFERWRFLKRSDKEIGVDDDTIELKRGVREVGRVAGKVLSMFVWW